MGFGFCVREQLNSQDMYLEFRFDSGKKRCQELFFKSLTDKLFSHVGSQFVFPLLNTDYSDGEYKAEARMIGNKI